MRASHIRFRGTSASRRLARRMVAAAVVAGTLTLARTLAAHADALVVVGPGDTLSAIAAAHDTTVERIVARNGLASADLVYSGQRLLVPDGAADVGREAEWVDGVEVDAGPASAAAAGAPAATVDAQVDAVWHVATPGDTLFSVAMAYGTTVRAIARANGIGPTGFIRAGRRLVVPGAKRASGGDAAGDPIEAPGADATRGGDVASGERRIVVDLSDQTVSAFAGGRLVNRFIGSTGAAWTPTPLGSFAVYARLDRQRMTGPGYDLPNVPFVQYFTGSYAIHGAYWHQDFGVPVSHGCVNLQPGDAAWLYDWADYGTPVVVQR